MKKDTGKTTLIHKVLEGNATGAEKKELRDWMSLSEANKEFYEDLRLHWEAGHKVQDEHFYDGLYKIKARVKQKRLESRRIKTMVSMITLMVSIAIAIVVPVFLYKVTNGEARGNLVFIDEKLGHVIASVQREYGILIETDHKEILTCPFTGTFVRAGATDVVQNLAEAMGLDYERKGDGTYLLKGSGCLNQPMTRQPEETSKQPIRSKAI